MKKIEDIQALSIITFEVAEKDRLIEDHKRLLELVNIFKSNGFKIVYTMGAYDLSHIV